MRKSNPAFLNGVPEMLLLQLLTRRPMYGYELVQAIKSATGGQLEFGEGCVYPILHRLEEQKLLVSSRQSVGGRQRFVYDVTERGRANWPRPSEPGNASSTPSTTLCREMNVHARPWLEQVQRELHERKLPPLYVERFLSELSDHIFDSMEDPMSTDARDLHKLAHHLGTPSEIAATAAKEYRRAHFCRRHPVLMFVALPVVVLPLAWAASMVVIIALAKAFGLETGGAGIGGSVYQWAEVNAQVVMLAMLVIPVALVAALFCRMAIKAGVSWKWMLTTCSILAVIGGAAAANLIMPGEVTRGTFSFGFGFSLHPSYAQLFQLAVPLAIGGWAIWRQLSQRPGRLAG